MLLFNILFLNAVADSTSKNSNSTVYTVSADSSNLIDSTIYLFGNVKFKHKDLTIYSINATITSEKVVAKDSVDIFKFETDDTTEINCGEGEYFWDRDIKLFGVFTVNKRNETLSGDTGRYLNDSLWVNNNAVYMNSKDSIKVTGNHGFYEFDAHKGLMTDSAILYIISDSIEISADTIKFAGDTASRKNTGEAMGNVVMKLKDTNCYGNYAIYFQDKDIAEIHGNPYIVSKTDSIAGDKIKILLTDRKIKQLIVSGKVKGTRWQL